MPASQSIYQSKVINQVQSVVIAGYARTPFTKINGALSSLSAVSLGAHSVKAALLKTGIEPSKVDCLIAGQVLQAGCGQNPARQTAIQAGIPLSTPALTVNSVCLSGMEAIASGMRMIESGEAEIVVVVGQESMSMAPHAWIGSRSGKKFGAISLIDTLEIDGLTDAFQEKSMGLSTEEYISDLNISRKEQDQFALVSHLNAANSKDFLSEEIAPIDVVTKNQKVSISLDDGIRPDTTLESLSHLRPAFTQEGTITAGNSSQLTDGAASVIIMSENAAIENQITGLAKIISRALVSGPDYSLHSQPSNAIRAALDKVNIEPSKLSAVEINEAFSAVGIQSTRELKIDPSIVNIHGGAIALGHPIGASGTRIVGHLARTIQLMGKGSLGAAGICGGGGQGSSLILEAI